MRYLLLLLGLLSFSPASFAQQPTPPWLHTDVLIAALGIDLTEEQKPQFREALTDLVNGHAKSTSKLLRRDNVSNIKQKIKAATNREFKRMDKRVAGFLTEAQYPKYEIYRGLLRDKMGGGIRGSTDTEMGVANSALNANSASH